MLMSDTGIASWLKCLCYIARFQWEGSSFQTAPLLFTSARIAEARALRQSRYRVLISSFHSLEMRYIRIGYSRFKIVLTKRGRHCIDYMHCLYYHHICTVTMETIIVWKSNDSRDLKTQTNTTKKAKKEKKKTK